MTAPTGRPRGRPRKNGLAEEEGASDASSITTSTSTTAGTGTGNGNNASGSTSTPARSSRSTGSTTTTTITGNSATGKNNTTTNTSTPNNTSKTRVPVPRPSGLLDRISNSTPLRGGTSSVNSTPNTNANTSTTGNTTNTNGEAALAVRRMFREASTVPTASSTTNATSAGGGPPPPAPAPLPTSTSTSSNLFGSSTANSRNTTTTSSHTNCACDTTLRLLTERIDQLEGSFSNGLASLRADVAAALLSPNGSSAALSNLTASLPKGKKRTNASIIDPLLSGSGALTSNITSIGTDASKKRARFSENNTTTSGSGILSTANATNEDGTPLYTIGRVNTIEDAFHQWNTGDLSSGILPLKSWTKEMIAASPQRMVYYQRRQLATEFDRLNGDLEAFKNQHGNTLTGAGESVRQKAAAEGKLRRRSRKSTGNDSTNNVNATIGSSNNNSNNNGNNNSNTNTSTYGNNAWSLTDGGVSSYELEDTDPDADEDERMIANSALVSAHRAISNPHSSSSAPQHLSQQHFTTRSQSQGQQQQPNYSNPLAAAAAAQSLLGSGHGQSHHHSSAGGHNSGSNGGNAGGNSGTHNLPGISHMVQQQQHHHTGAQGGGHQSHNQNTGYGNSHQQGHSSAYYPNHGHHYLSQF